MGYHPLEHRVLHTIRSHHLFDSEDKLLVALSGGLDSMVLLHMLHRLHYSVAAAHMNFGLRGIQSDEDAVFCEQICRNLQIPYYHTSVETLAHAAREKVSVQMAARHLRYTWFNEISKSHGYTFIATAHHLNDQAETIILNLSEGRSAGSLKGIPLRNGKIVRPFLEISRDEILNYAKEKNIEWREDESNLTDAYKRNFLRHQVMPLLENMQPAAISNISKTAIRMNEWNLLAEEMAEKILHPCFEEKNGTTLLHLQTIITHPSCRLLLWKALSRYGFEGNIIDDIAEHLAETGRIFLSPRYRITIDRDKLFIESLEEKTPETTSLAGDLSTANFGRYILSVRFTGRAAIPSVIHPDTALLDGDKLNFPLTVRSWKQGDTFTPLGMQQEKKISDFFIDTKIPLPEKPKIPLVCSGDKIVWIGGHRISEHFKITDETRKIAIIEIKINTQYDAL